jgi:hypothetical protein
MAVLMFLSLLLERHDCKKVAATPLSQVDKSASALRTLI